MKPISPRQERAAPGHSRSRDHESRPPRHSARSRSRSPHHRNHPRKHRDRSPELERPSQARSLHRQDFDPYRSLFAEYLEVQKRLNPDDLSEREIRGRWKSFARKWNRGELAEGWYDPDLKARVDARRAVEEQGTRTDGLERPQRIQQKSHCNEVEHHDENSNDEDSLGPALDDFTASRRPGPAIPELQDLQHRQELTEEDREARLTDLRFERKQDRKTQNERLEELAPRADPGSRERQLEKKREMTATNRAFADSKDAGTEEIRDGDLMGDDGVDAYKKQLRDKKRAKTEREVRKEEILRARAAEREEKLSKLRNKEEKTMSMLKEIARQRFGGEGA